MIDTYSKGRDQPGKVANPARGQLNRENDFFFRPRLRLRIFSRETGSAISSRASLPISILRLNLVLNYEIPREFRGGVHFVWMCKDNSNVLIRQIHTTHARDILHKQG